MRRVLAVLAVVLALGLAQRAEVSGGSPFGLQGGVRLVLVPFLVEGRLYAGTGAGASGGGVDLLLKLPLTDLYLGLGGFLGTGPGLTLPREGRGQVGVRAVLGTWLNLPLPLLGVFAELHPTYYPATGGLGLGGGIGVSLGF
ncbi:MAG: hypothetical protein NZ846_03605 [Thermus sp.]|uniref:hypothetical protein n=1 Tax=Thermus sp. TaxID=275 RepID=UPI0025EB6DBE|nr:hypothetical protein [Thermus sp.]MCS6868476.1 hypothetical protein [Thermus sp.]MCS7218048.1 hypothetical protein [Thermus sp.]MCX7849813.1 hypothetical protein [Thermus sp.]MDW8017290.1 hypothetical protein [Thermus sp.]MDW8357736.1 hypothetical protein [Thermus sp.]